MKDKEKRNKKGSESTIGKIIYGFLLFMPLIAIGLTCLVNTFNTQAKESLAIDYKYETNEVNQQDDLENNKIYHLEIELNNSNIGKMFFFTSVYNLITTANSNVKYENNLIYNGRYMRIATNSSIQIFENNIALYVYSVPTNFECDLVINQFTEKTDYTYFNKCQNIPYDSINQKDLDNIFYYAVDKVTESPLFSWAENSIIYTTTNATCNALSITTPFIPLLLSYWLIISVMYFLYDIALMLIWVLHDRIHALKDSIT